MESPLLVIGFIAYVVAGILSTWLGYWWFVSWVVFSLAVGLISAMRDREFWPIVHPQIGFFFTFPALLVGYGLFLNHPAEWAQWLAWAALLALLLTAFLTLRWRKWIDREWAVVGTLTVVFVLLAFGLTVANATLDREPSRVLLVSIVSEDPGGYRRPPHISVSTENGGRMVFLRGGETSSRFLMGSRFASMSSRVH